MNDSLHMLIDEVFSALLAAQERGDVAVELALRDYLESQGFADVDGWNDAPIVDWIIPATSPDVEVTCTPIYHITQESTTNV